MGCGPQEQFYGCSDIRITNESGSGQVIQQTQPTQPQTVVVTNSNQVASLYGQCNKNPYKKY